MGRTLEALCLVVFLSIPYGETAQEYDYDYAEVLGKNEKLPPRQEYHTRDDHIAKELAKQVKVLCWVLPHPIDYNRHIADTWGPRCNKIIYLTALNETHIPLMILGTEPLNSWSITKDTLYYIYKRYYGEYDWFMKANTDTFVVAENLRYMLKDYNASEPEYFGCQLQHRSKQNENLKFRYMYSDSGYVLSKEALRRLVEDGLSNKCRNEYTGREDIKLGKCLAAVGVRLVDTRDALRRGRFLPFPLEYHLMPDSSSDEAERIEKYLVHPLPRGWSCCSDVAITFSHVSVDFMYLINYHIYHLRPIGFKHLVNGQNITLPRKPVELSPAQKAFLTGRDDNKKR